MNNYSDFDIEYVLRVLAHPELEDTEAFQAWIHEQGHKKLYLDVRAAYDGLALKEKALPDLQLEWESFRKRIDASDYRESDKHVHLSPSHQRNIWIRRWVVAASFLLLITAAGILTYRGYIRDKSTPLAPVALMETKSAPQDVLLTAEDGHQLVISEQINRDSLAALGTTIDKDKKLAYVTNNEQQENAIHTLSTPRGKDFKLVLSDGTEVWLNAESTLRYPAHFTGSQRVVELSGEAYFKVAKDAEHPFIVKTDGIETQVLGTSFNLRNYEHATPHVTLVEGKVLVTGYQTSVSLSPGEDARIQKNGTIQVRSVDTRSYTAWTNGYFYFENVSLKEIMSELGRWYNLTIIFSNPQAMDYHFNFWAKRKEPVENVLELINGLGKVKVSIEKDVLTIN